MKKYLRIGIYSLVVVASIIFYKNVNQSKVQDVLLLNNIEALANDEYTNVSCYGTGSVDCPIRHDKVEYVFEYSMLDW